MGVQEGGGACWDCFVLAMLLHEDPCTGVEEGRREGGGDKERREE